MAKDTLIEALDDGAKKLLEMAMAPTKNDDGTPNVTTLAERVKAFDSAAKWAETRLEVVPKKPERSKFDELRDRFDDTETAERGGTSRKAKKGEPHANGSGLTGGDLFS